ncbi:MAG TPA: AAA family ATPase [Methylibium sp.]|nr:AAA family ATPase [Methylibium sp.]
MYARFFGLQHEPFSIAPDPRYLFMSERHREALAHLLYGLGGGGGFVLLTGEIGAGKTTVCRCFLEQIPKHCNVAYVFNPRQSAAELMRSVCDEFRIPVAHAGDGPPTIKDCVDALNAFLLKTHAVGHNNLLIIDEAQQLDADVLEQLRLLTNLETNERKLLQIVLIGQPELREMLARPELEQLAQRVIARYHLGALAEAETIRYVRHRLVVAGLATALPFDAEGLRTLHRLARGVPRRINLLADRALLGAFSAGQTKVTRPVVEKAADEVFGRDDAAPPPSRRQRATLVGAGVLAGAALAGGIGWALASLEPAPPAPSTAVVVAAPPADAAASAPPPPVTTTTTTVAPETAAAVPPDAAPSAPPASASAAASPPPVAEPALAGFRDEGDALRALATLWKVPLPADGGDPCTAARDQGLPCWRGRLTLEQVRALDRPGLLTLQGVDGASVYALLTALDGERAQLQAGAAVRSVRVADLEVLWAGDFATLWRAPAGYAGQAIDDRGDPLAGWVLQRLDRVAPGTGELRDRIVAFQRRHELAPDGIAGPATLMALNRASGVDEPRLAGTN